MNTKRFYRLLLVVLLSAAACSSTPSPTPPTTLPATAEPPTAALTAVAPSATAATAPQTATQLLAGNWDDRAIFRAGLIKDEQVALDQLPGASVYHLDVQLADDLASLQGQLRVRYTNQENEPLDAVYFQLFPNMAGGKSTVSNVKVDREVVEPVYESQNATVRVPLTTPLSPGEHVVIQLDFKVEVPTEIGGNYGLFGYLNDILVLDGFYPAIPECR